MVPMQSTFKHDVHSETAGDYNEGDGILGRYIPHKAPGSVIAKIARSFYYVRESVLVSDLADSLISNENIYAVAVVDDMHKVLGIIVRRELFDLLGKAFGRDLYTHKTVRSVMSGAGTFHVHDHIFAVAEQIAPFLNNPLVTDYVLVNDDGGFAGIFSTRDMLIYLSEITQRDIEMARRLQMSMVKEETCETNEYFSIIGSSVMARGVGGDFYALKKYDRDNWFITVCDVSGKGMSASLVSSIIGGMLSLYDFSAGIRHFVIKLNEYIHSTFESEKFVTGIFAGFNEKTGEMNIFDAGHSYLYVFRADKMIRINTREDTVPIGIMPSFLPKGGKFTFQKSDLLVLVTDGILEQINPHGAAYGIARLTDVIRKFRSQGLKRIKDEVIADIGGHRKNIPQNDDITVLLMEYH